MDRPLAFLHGMKGPAALSGEEALFQLRGDSFEPGIGMYCCNCRENVIYLHVLHNLHAPSSFFSFKGLCLVRLHKQTCYFMLMWFSAGEILALTDLWICGIWIYFIFSPPTAHSCRDGNTQCSTISEWPHPFWLLISLTAAGWVLPQHFDRFKTSHWGIGSSPCSLGGCDQKAWLCTVQVQLRAYMYYTNRLRNQ